ncbi:NTE family protein [Pseudoxanthomonas sp. CF385]|uniref:patatin-like phospholipase family protein n=1 Tax=Pseudoxanthomonas sp. CF385 TaxID=1881042 RepID=UPI00088FBF2F|nr:patatin-like phospholipase family protein [Pseudoxanthomonas sp. CF385]SDQ56120.1 NTE family protein [Pseudoxanthomonas sp. CF385]
MPRTTHFLLSCCLLLAHGLASADARAQTPEGEDAASASRPKTCLVLGGGGARGGAHVGVLKVLERERVPIDCIVGTSMGAIVGGLYAAGYSADEIQAILDKVDWNAELRDKPPRSDRGMRRKEDDLRLLGGIELGIHEGSLAFPRGVIQGQRLELLLRKLLLPVATVHDFDALAIPFRAVATDIVKGEKVVFAEGDLAAAIRASMSVPGVFAPVKIDGRLLVDGGVLDNVPVDEARKLGAERLIVSRVGSPLRTEEGLTSPLAITEQMSSILMQRAVEAQLATLGAQDLLLAPDLGDIASEQFNRAPEAVAPGERAADAVVPQLQRYAVDADAYAAFTARHRMPRFDTPVVRFVEVDGRQTGTETFVEQRLVPLVGKPLDVPAVEQTLATLYGEGRYEKIGWTPVRRDEAWGLQVNPVDKAWGPDFLHLSLRLSDDFDGASAYQFIAELTRTGLSEAGAEARVRAAIGQEAQLFLEYYHPLGLRAHHALSTYLQYRATNRDISFVEGDLGDYRYFQAYGGARWTYSPHRDWEFAAFLERGHERVRFDLGDPALRGRYHANLGSLGLQLRHDSIDSSTFPTHGHRASLTYQRFDDALGSSVDSAVARLQWDGAWSWREHRWVGGVRASTSTGSDALLATYGFLGGLGNLSGYAEQSVFAPHTALLRLMYYRRVLHTDSLITLPLYVGGSAEWGGFWATREDASFGSMTPAGSVFVGADSPLGPIFLGWGRAEGGRDSFYLTFGSLLRTLDGF